MSEERLRALLRDTRVPDADGAERRGLAVARAAFAQRPPAGHRPRPRRLAIALAAATLGAALLLSPAGAAVRDWIDDTFTAGVRDAEPALTEVPGGGRLLVQSPSGPWVVEGDGSRRLLGRYGGATWSPRGLYVAVAEGRSLSAVEPDGTVHWSLSARRRVSDPRWSPSGFRIAYRAGRALRVVAGDGTGEMVVDRSVAPLPAAWAPLGPHVLAYLDDDGRVRAVDVDSGETLAASPAAGGIIGLDWGARGTRLLEATRSAIRLREVSVGKLAGNLRMREGRAVRIPGGAEVIRAALGPRGDVVAALLRLPARGSRGARSEVVLASVSGGPARTLFRTPGTLSDLAWSPDGRRLLIGWPEADQWLFIPASGRRPVRAIGGISAQFAPGARPEALAFPSVEGWCCAAGPDPAP